MDPANKDLYYQKINELLQDEEKIITCTSLALDLELPINEAKALLSDFVHDFNQVKSDHIYSTFILTGSLKNSKSLAIYLVKEEDLNEKKTLFDTVYTQLLYSIQKCKNIDLNGIALIDKTYLESEKTLPGSIVGKNCIKRNIKKREIQEVVKTEQGKDSKSFFKKFSSNNVTTQNSKDSQSQEKSQEKQPKVNQKSGIVNYFAKASTTNTKPNGINKQEINGDKSVKNGDTITKETKLEDKVDIGKENLENVKMEVEPVNLPSNESQSKSSSKKRKKTAKNDDSTNKKRKRIQEICDSDSDMFDDEKEDIIGISDEEPEQIIIKPDLPTKKRVMKTVDEVHMDEEGFMVTTVKYVFESVSEDEEEKKTKSDNIVTPEQKPKVLKKNDSTGSENGGKKQQNKGNKNSKKAAVGKQTTLMNFFKRN